MYFLKSNVLSYSTVALWDHIWKKKCFIEFKLLVPSLLQISWVLLNCKSTYIINIFYVIIVLHFTNKYEYDEYEPITLHKKIKFFIKDFFRKFLQLTSTEEILNGKLHFLCSVNWVTIKGHRIKLLNWKKIFFKLRCHL